jgi:UDPglucose 6-dehydrogenase
MRLNEVPRDRYLRLAFCPEFLRERARFSDFIDNHELCIAGTFKASDAELIKSAHGSLPKHFIRMLPTEAELAKYFVNCFNAQRIVFANAFYDVCQQLGADYTVIKDAVTKRSGIGPDYLICNEQTREFGGSCLPKDTEAFRSFVDGLGLATEVFDTIVRENKRVERRHILMKEPDVETAVA